MFVLWLNTRRITIPKQQIVSINPTLAKLFNITGYIKAPIIEPSDMYLVIATIITNISKSTKPTGKFVQRMVVMAVTTPLPPLNL